MVRTVRAVCRPCKSGVNSENICEFACIVRKRMLNSGCRPINLLMYMCIDHLYSTWFALFSLRHTVTPVVDQENAV